MNTQSSRSSFRTRTFTGTASRGRTRDSLKASAKWGAILAFALACPFQSPANDAPSAEETISTLFSDAPSKMGLPDGMPLFPSSPVPGYPAATSAPYNGWDQPEYVNYPGSIEHFRVDKQAYTKPINPYNHRSLIKNFIAAELPGVPANLKETFAEPAQYVAKGGLPPIKRTGITRPPVPVVRLKPGGQRLDFRLDPQPIGLYVVRVIGALETKDVRDTGMPLDLVLEMTVNDGPKGEVNRYIIRQRGTDNFYSLGEFFVRVNDDQKRPLEVSVALHPDSKVDLLVHNVDVHDELAECAKRGGKTKSLKVDAQLLTDNWKFDAELLLAPAKRGEWATMINNFQTDNFQFDNLKRHASVLKAIVKSLKEEFPEGSDAELYGIWRKRQDAAVWNCLPSINQNYAGPVGNTMQFPHSEVDPDTLADLKAKGAELLNFRVDSKRKDVPESLWQFDKSSPMWRLKRKTSEGVVEYYTIDDLAKHKPLPGMPFDDVSWGKRFEKDAKTYLYHPLAQATGFAFRKAIIEVGKSPRGFLESGDMDAARDQALMLCRLAYDLPTYSSAHSMYNQMTPPEDIYGWPIAHQQRRRLYQVFEAENLAATYDALFPFIQGNQSLADAVGEFIPWVKTSEDIIKLIDTHLLQWGAKQSAYQRTCYDSSVKLAKLAAYQGDPSIATPWVWLIFNWSWEYPEEYGGIEDFIYSSTQRDGSNTRGSFFYAKEGSYSARLLPHLQDYLDQGGDRRYDLSDPKRFPRLFVAPYFQLEARVAGMYGPAIGDVGGPNSVYGHWMETIGDSAITGWNFTRDPRFAYLYTHYGKAVPVSAREKEEMKAAVDSVPRNPFMAQRSRVLSDWGGILEGGTQSDDFRFRHALRIRVGSGSGHAHSDGLDLGLWSLGLPMAGDAGARGEYGRPSCFASRIHNVVTDDAKDWAGDSWVSDLADMDGAQYLRAQGYRVPNNFVRQVSLIELDQGKSAKNPPSNSAMGPGTTYDNDIVLPRAYAVDFFRAHGKNVAYNFHGPTDDEFTTNVQPGQLVDKDQEMLKDYVVEGQQWGGTIGEENLVATWRMAREPQKFVEPERGSYVTPASEPHILGEAYDPASPRKYLRVHVLGQKGQRFLTGLWVSAPPREVGDAYRQAHVVREAEKSSLFAAVWEPYAGTPVIKSARLEGDQTNADSPAAVHVETVDGIRDTIYASPTPDKLTALSGGMRVMAQYAYFSEDASGLRQASVVEGETLETRLLEIRPDVARWKAEITDIDHLEKTATLDRALPEKLLDGAFYEVGRPESREEYIKPKWTSFEAVTVKPGSGGQSILHWRKGADVMSGKIAKVERRESNCVDLTFDRGFETCAFVTNSERKKLWRAQRTGRTIRVSGGDISDEDFKVGQRIYGYEVGPGDTWRVATKVSLRRESPGIYRLQANTGCELRLAGQATWSNDGKTWMPIPAGQGGRAVWKVTEAQLQAGAVYLKWAGNGR